MLNSDGQVAQHFASFLDITRRKQDEKRAKLLLAGTGSPCEKHACHPFRRSPGRACAERRSESRCRGPSRDVFWRSPMPTHYLRAKSWEGARLGEVIEQVLQPFGLKDRFSIHGDDVYLEAGTALALAMTFHELATNAVKHGARSDDAGHVDITWQTWPPQSCERYLAALAGARWSPVSPSRAGMGTGLPLWSSVVWHHFFFCIE